MESKTLDFKNNNYAFMIMVSKILKFKSINKMLIIIKVLLLFLKSRVLDSMIIKILLIFFKSRYFDDYGAKDSRRNKKRFIKISRKYLLFLKKRIILFF